MPMNGMESEVDPQAIKAIDTLTRELESIKRLLVLLLMKGGSSQAELARALGVGQATISRLGIGKVGSFGVEAKTSNGDALE